MKDFQQRVVDEQLVLDNKRCLLDAFMKDSIYFDLPEDEQHRLVKQSRLMFEYSEILQERIEAFE